MSNTFNIFIEDKTVTKLAGNEYGREIYNQQVKGKIDFNNKICISFPERIDYIGSSFIQGFFAEIVSNIGIKGVEDNVVIISSIEDEKKDIINNLL